MVWKSLEDRACSLHGWIHSRGLPFPPFLSPFLSFFFPRRSQRERERESSSGTRRITMALLESIGHPVESHSRMCLRTREGSVFSPSLKQTALTCAIDGIIITTCAFLFFFLFVFLSFLNRFIYFSPPLRIFIIEVKSSNKDSLYFEKSSFGLFKNSLENRISKIRFCVQ